MSKEKVCSFILKHPKFFTNNIGWVIDNWNVIKAFENIALDIIYVGRDHYSARTIVEVMRHNSVIADTDKEFKLNNNSAPDLARIFVVLHPEFVDFWDYRRGDADDFRDIINGLQNV